MLSENCFYILLYMLQSLLIIVNVCYFYIVHLTRISMYIGYWTLNKYYYYCVVPTTRLFHSREKIYLSQ